MISNENKTKWERDNWVVGKPLLRNFEDEWVFMDDQENIHIDHYIDYIIRRDIEGDLPMRSRLLISDMIDSVITVNEIIEKMMSE